MDLAMGMQDFEVFANRNLRSFELAREFCDQNPALMGQQIENGATAFFVEHWSWLAAKTVVGRRFVRISFYSVLFRLSTGNVGVENNGGDAAFSARAVRHACVAAFSQPRNPCFCA